MLGIVAGCVVGVALLTVLKKPLLFVIGMLIAIVQFLIPVVKFLLKIIFEVIKCVFLIVALPFILINKAGNNKVKKGVVR